MEGWHPSFRDKRGSSRDHLWGLVHHSGVRGVTTWQTSFRARGGSGRDHVWWPGRHHSGVEGGSDRDHYGGLALIILGQEGKWQRSFMGAGTSFRGKRGNDLADIIQGQEGEWQR